MLPSVLRPRNRRGVWLQFSKVYFVTSPPGVWLQLSKAFVVLSRVRPFGVSRATSFVMILAINDPLSLPYYHCETVNIPAEPL